ncbi:MAG: NAD(P)/FAD-dependent oxidoreductase [Pirellulales bacterium]
MKQSKLPVVIVGSGLAGLCCARELTEQGVAVEVLEAGDGVGGRVRTDEVDGFLLDHGFQVLQTAYPEAQRVLDYPALQLRPFEPGALIHWNGRVDLLSDPWRRPSQAPRSLFNGLGSLIDRWKLAQMRFHLVHTPLASLLREPDSTTGSYLSDEWKFSDEMIERFFRPWLSGVFLERELRTSSRFFKFIFRMFALGDTALPARGMGAITAQLADRLPAGSIQLNTQVARVEGTEVRLANGRTLAAQAVVVATDGPAAALLTGRPELKPESRATTCFYFAAERPPVADPILVLNGDPTGPINHLCVPSQVASTYAPTGKSLISVSVLGEAAGDELARLELDVRHQLADWFGPEALTWRPLRSYTIRHALPAQPVGRWDEPSPTNQCGPRLFACGDYRESASIQGAMLSGRRTAEEVLTLIS